jgi:preprotein translocase subunit SecG
MDVALQIATIVLSLILIGLIMIQVRGEGMGSLLGGDFGGGLTRTRRGLERTVFQITVGLAALFLLICIFAAVFSR